MNDEMNILDVKKNIKKTVDDLESYKSFPSNDYLMLCELIDNSISSYISKHDDSVNGLNIDITVDRTNKKNYTLTVIDNAEGMSPAVLENAIYFGNPKKIKKLSTLNIYGVGLKQSAFYSGRRLDILTKTKDYEKCLETHIDLTELEKTSSKEIVFMVKRTEEEIFIKEKKLESGTMIKFSYLRRNRYSLENKKDIFMQHIGWKYGRYIKAGLKIFLQYKNGDEKSEFGEFIIPSSPKAENYNLWKENLEKINNYNKNGENFICQELDEKMKTCFKKNRSLEEEEIYNDFMGKILSGKDMIWDKEIEVKKNVKIIGKIGILANPTTLKYSNNKSQKYTTHNGFSLFQKGRAIKCGPNSKKYNVSNYNVIQVDISGGQNQKRRWFGEFDMDSLIDEDGSIMELDSNKSDLRWVDIAAKKRFDDGLRKFINEYDDCLLAFNHFQNNNTRFSLNNNKKENNEIAEGVRNSSKISDVKIKEGISKNDLFEYCVDILDKNKIYVNVSIESINENEEYFIKYNKLKSNSNGDYQIKISINVNHKIWKPLLTNDKHSSSTEALISIHKLAIVQGITQWMSDYISQKENVENKNLEIFSKFNGKSYTEVCSELAKSIFGIK